MPWSRGTRSWSETRRVYNLTVDTDHTYFVVAGQKPVLTHNCSEIDESYVHVDSLNVARGFRKGKRGSGSRRGSLQLYSGMQSPDGKRGWRMDFDPDSAKGVHINWWDKTSGPKRNSGWQGGAAVLDGLTEGDYRGIIRRFPWAQY